MWEARWVRGDCGRASGIMLLSRRDPTGTSITCGRIPCWWASGTRAAPRGWSTSGPVHWPRSPHPPRLSPVSDHPTVSAKLTCFDFRGRPRWRSFGAVYTRWPPVLRGSKNCRFHLRWPSLETARPSLQARTTAGKHRQKERAEAHASARDRIRVVRQKDKRRPNRHWRSPYSEMAP